MPDAAISGSSAPASRATEKMPVAVLHRVQLVSGRPLASWPVPESFGPARFGDVDVATEDTVFALDVIGKRIFSVAPRTGHYGRPTRLPFEHPTSLAVVSKGTAYIAHDAGISRVRLPAGAATPLRAAPGVDLKGFERIRWDGHALLGIQRTDDGSLRAVRLRLGPSAAACSPPTSSILYCRSRTPPPPRFPTMRFTS